MRLPDERIESIRKLLVDMRAWSGEYLSDLRVAQIRIRECANALEALLDERGHFVDALHEIADADVVHDGNDLVDAGVCEGHDDMAKIARKTLGLPDVPRCPECSFPTHDGEICRECE